MGPMASAKAFIGSVLGQFLFHQVTVTQVRELSPRFRWIGFAGEGLRDEPCEAGDKIQVFLPSLGMRTYTPLAWDSGKGTGALLVYLHGASPGADWGRTVRPGERFQFLGPRRSLKLGEHAGPVVLFGDETSLGLAGSLRTDAKLEVTSVLEVTSREESAAVLRELGLEGAEVERTPGDAHLLEVHERLRAALAQRPEALLVLTGRAQSIQALKSRFKLEGPRAASRSKPYWSVGKTGLD